MRAVLHWLRSVIILSGLCALPCGQAAPSAAPEASPLNRPTLVLVSIGSTMAGTAMSATSARGANFVEASAPVTLGSLRYGVRDLAAAPAAIPRTEAMPASFGAGKLQHIEPSDHGRAPPEGNSLLAIMLAAMGMAALAAARPPASRAPSMETMPKEPARQ
jgi:hypothetical protein